MRQRRLVELIKDYDCIIDYHLGKVNVVADDLTCKDKAIRGGPSGGVKLFFEWVMME